MIYGIAATISVTQIRTALRSDDLNLAIDKLQIFVADFMVQWSEVSTLEVRICITTWALMVCCCGLSVAMDLWQHGLVANDPLKWVEITMNAALLSRSCLVQNMW